MSVAMLIILFLNFQCIKCIDYDIMMQLHDSLLSNYSKHIQPKKNLSELLVVKIQFFIQLILNYDETTGIITLYGTFMQSWKDDFIQWDVNEFQGITNVTLPLKSVWIPKLLLKNSAFKRTLFSFDNDLDYETSFVSYNNQGVASCETSGAISFSCGADMTYYPADTQNCHLELYPERNRIELAAMFSVKNTFTHAVVWMELCSEWIIQNVSSKTFNKEDFSTLEICIKMRRKPVFLFLTLIMPLFLVSFVNIFAFILPVESGERTSFSVTLFLTFVFVMAMAADSLPSTTQLGFLMVFIIIKLLTSSWTTVMIIVSTSFYFNKGKPSDKASDISNEHRNVKDEMSTNLACKQELDMAKSKYCCKLSDDLLDSSNAKSNSKRLDNICMSVLAIELTIEVIVYLVWLV